MEVSPSHRQIEVVESSQPSAARFAAHEIAGRAGFANEDIHRAGLVATELATNLVKHATGGEILVRDVSRGPDSEIELIAIDRGPGIPPHQREAVVGPFQRLGDGSNVAGVGLGLAVAKGFVEAMDGHLELDDTPGGGLTATMTLPLAPRPGGGAETTTPDRASPTDAPTTPAASHP